MIYLFLLKEIDIFVANTKAKNQYRMKMPQFLKNFYWFYRDGFSQMTVGKTLWTIALLKLFIMFAILKVFFFPNFLKTNFDDDESRSDYVRKELIERTK